MAKPFSIQSPEEIAKEYGGNKQKIGQAMQLGIVDPTAGVLAGMFIDRMRSAQMQEQANPPTVAQQVMGGVLPQPPGLPAPGGVGMPPQGTPPMAPPPGMGAMPPPDMGAMPPPGMGAPPVGMAEGGIVGLDIPDTMFDESSNGGFDEGYAGGGLVAFGPGGSVSEDDPNEIVVYANQAPDNYYGNYANIDVMRDEVDRFYKPEHKRSDALVSYYDTAMSPAEQKKRRDEDKYLALAMMGAKMAQTPGSFLQAASAGMQQAIPVLAQSAKDRRAEKIDAMKTLAQNERMNNKDALDLYNLYREGQNKYGEFHENNLDREQEERLKKLEFKYGIQRELIQASAQRYTADSSRRASKDYASQQMTQLERQASLEAPKLARDDLAGNQKYQIAVRTNDIATMNKMLEDRIAYYRGQIVRGGAMGGSDGADAGQGRRVSQGRIVNAVPIPK